MPSSGNSLLAGLAAMRPAGAYQSTAKPQLARTQAEKASEKKAAAKRKKTFGRPVRLSAAAPPPLTPSYVASTIPATSSGKTSTSSSPHAGLDNEDEAARSNSLAAVIKFTGSCHFSCP